MDLSMSIAQLSSGMASSKVAMQASVSIAKKSMDVAETQMQGIVEMMGSTPSFGHSLDIRA